MGFFGKNIAAKAAANNSSVINNASVQTTGTQAPVETPTPQPQQTAPAPAPAPKAETKTTEKQAYVPAKDAFEAKQRVEKMMAENLVILETPSDSDRVVFKGQTYRLTREFRMLGGDFDKTTNLWSVPAAAWYDPSTATATKSERQQKREERNAESEAEIQKRIDAAVAEAVKTVTPADMITVEQAKANTRKAIELLLLNLSKMNPTALEALVNKVYAA